MKTHRSRIYVVCPDLEQAAGGVKQIYRQADILDRNGVDAFVLHQAKGFRVRGFSTEARIAYNRRIFEELAPPERGGIRSRLVNFLKGLEKFMFSGAFRMKWFKSIWCSMTIPEAKLRREDVLMIPEFYGRSISAAAKGIRKVIFNQNAHYTFGGYPLTGTSLETPYSHPEVLATVVISEQNRNYLRYVFPDHHLHRNHYGINPRVFSCHGAKKKQMAFMIRKIAFEVEEVINLLKFRGNLREFTLVIIDKMPEQEVARTLQESMIFLSFSNREGCPMPPMEAMACGCVVIGYDGFGGREYFKEEFSYPVPEGDSVRYCQSVEKAIQDYYDDPAAFINKGRRASEFISREYSEAREEADILEFWDGLAARHGFVLRDSNRDPMNPAGLACAPVESAAVAETLE